MSVFKPITKRLYRVAAGSVRAANVRHYRGHGVHSPFVYSLVRQVFMRRRVEGSNTALYADLVLRHVSRRRATQLQNLYTHCGYENFLFRRYGLEDHGERRRRVTTYSVVIALIPATGATARPDTISTNELNVDHSQ